MQAVAVEQDLYQRHLFLAPLGQRAQAPLLDRSDYLSVNEGPVGVTCSSLPLQHLSVETGRLFRTPLRPDACSTPVLQLCIDKHSRPLGRDHPSSLPTWALLRTRQPALSKVHARTSCASMTRADMQMMTGFSLLDATCYPPAPYFCFWQQ